ncbi:MAG: hypothetical protein KAT37_03210 [Candidatus Aenigmarchaeota archaeon]|nr:hypothetical protein [Candidatus Aenigmarchaeota archaeon]
MEGILKEIEKYPEEERLHELTKTIYRTIPEMFEKEFFEPVGVEIHYGHSGTQKIYTQNLAENIARKLLGLEVKGGKGDSWEDAQRRLGVIK